MKKVIRLTESDLMRIVRKVIKESEHDNIDDSITYDIKSVDCKGHHRDGHVDIEGFDTIKIRYCKGDDKELDYLKRKGKQLIMSNLGGLFD